MGIIDTEIQQLTILLLNRMQNLEVQLVGSWVEEYTMFLSNLTILSLTIERSCLSDKYSDPGRKHLLDYQVQWCNFQWRNAYFQAIPHPFW